MFCLYKHPAWIDSVTQTMLSLTSLVCINVNCTTCSWKCPLPSPLLHSQSWELGQITSQSSYTNAGTKQVLSNFCLPSSRRSTSPPPSRVGPGPYALSASVPRSVPSSELLCHLLLPLQLVRIPANFKLRHFPSEHMGALRSSLKTGIRPNAS